MPVGRTLKRRPTLLLAAAAAACYTRPVMSEQEEDFNAFDHWDCLGASLFLGIMPAVLNFVFNDKDIVSTALLGAAGVAAAFAVFALAFITRWRIIGTLVNLVGGVLTVIYIAIAVYCWLPSGD